MIDEGAGPARGRRIVTRVTTGLASTAVLSLGALYLAAPSSSAFTIKARDGGAAAPGTVVLYGSVTNGSKQPISAAKLMVVREGSSNNSDGERSGRGGGVVGEVRTDPNGTYRLQLYVPPGEYDVEVALSNGTLHQDFHFDVPASASTTETAFWQGARSGFAGARISARHSGAPARLTSAYSGRNGSGDGDAGDEGDQGNQGDQGAFPPGRSFGLVTGNQVLSLVPGVSYEVSASLTTSNLLSFLPVSSY